MSWKTIHQTPALCYFGTKKMATWENGDGM